MVIPPNNLSSNNEEATKGKAKLMKNEEATKGKAKLMKKKKKKKPVMKACNKIIKKENTDTIIDQTIRKLDTLGASNAMERAIKFQSKLPQRYPSCVKFMLRSHVSDGFWLSLPKSFTNIHLPDHDAMVVLLGENYEEYSAKYLVQKNGLSAGWRHFSIAHNLIEGDVLVFQLIADCRIKVYIVRANSLSEIDGGIGHLNLELKDKPMDNGCVVNTIVKEEYHDMEDVNNLSVASASKKKKVVVEPCMTMTHFHQETIPDSPQLGSKSKTTDDGGGCSGSRSGSEMFGGIRFSEKELDFEDVRDLGSFSILVDGLVIDSEIPKHLRSKYYDLCCSQNRFLHNHLAKGLNCKLAAGIISETVNIADAIRATKLDMHCCDYLQTWDKTLKAFEDMGMAVGFLRDRIKKLVCLQHEEQEIIKAKMLERDQVEINERNLEAELARVKEVKRNLDAEIQVLKMKNENLASSFHEMATGPW